MTSPSVDERLTQLEATVRRIVDGTADAIDAMEVKLAAIDQQNQHRAEMVQVLGGYVNVSLEALQGHASDGHGREEA